MRRAGRRVRLPLGVGFALAFAFACAGESEPGEPGEGPGPAVAAGSLARTAPEDIRYDLENLGYEIADLESLIESGVEGAPGSDPGARLAEARRAYEAALEAVAADDPVAAKDRMETAADHVESVKRALGLAEEWGEPFDGDSIPVTVPEDLGS